MVVPKMPNFMLITKPVKTFKPLNQQRHYLHGVSYHNHSTLYRQSTSASVHIFPFSFMAAIRFVVQYQEYVAPGGPGKSWFSRRAVVASALTTIPEGQGSQFHIEKQGSRRPDNLQSREGEKQ
jgi:hypothetical protein